MRVGAVAALALPLGLLACSSERATVGDADRSPSIGAEISERDDDRVLHPGAPCAGLRAEQALCGSDEGGLAQPPVPQRDIPRVLDNEPGGALDSP